MSAIQPSEITIQRLNELRGCRTLADFVPLRAKELPQKTALCQYDRLERDWVHVTYGELQEKITAWRRALAALNLKRGARVAILLNNSVNAVLADQSVMAQALIPVPLHAIDTPGSLSFILGDSGAECLITSKLERWEAIVSAGSVPQALKTVVLTEEATPAGQMPPGPRVLGLED